MSSSVIGFLAASTARFVPAPGTEEARTLLPGERSLIVIGEGTGALLSSGAVTLVLLPVLAAGLYLAGFRVAGPLVGMFAIGLFLARMFGAPA